MEPSPWNLRWFLSYMPNLHRILNCQVWWFPDSWIAFSYKAPFLFGWSGYWLMMLMSVQDWRRRKEFLVDFSPGPAAECHWSSRCTGPGGSLAAFGNASRTAALQQPTRRDDARWRDETKNVKARSKKSKKSGIEFAHICMYYLHNVSDLGTFWVCRVWRVKDSKPWLIQCFRAERLVSWSCQVHKGLRQFVKGSQNLGFFLDDWTGVKRWKTQIQRLP